MSSPLSYAKFYVVLMKSPLLTTSAKLLLTQLVNLAGVRSNPSIDLLAGQLGVSRSTIERGLRLLRELRLIQITWGQRASRYQIAAVGDWERILIRQNDASEPVSDTSKRRNTIRQNDVSEPSVSLLSLKTTFKDSSVGSFSVSTLRHANTTQNAPAALVRAAPVDGSATPLRAVLEVFASFGRGCAPADRKRCERAWAKLSDADRRAAVAHIDASIIEWRSRPTEKIAQPWNYLEGRHWERVLQRRQPQRELNRFGRNIRIAAAKFISRHSGGGSA
jgi:hypothetical protein